MKSDVLQILSTTIPQCNIFRFTFCCLACLTILWSCYLEAFLTVNSQVIHSTPLQSIPICIQNFQEQLAEYKEKRFQEAPIIGKNQRRNKPTAKPTAPGGRCHVGRRALETESHRGERRRLMLGTKTPPVGGGGGGVNHLLVLGKFPCVWYGCTCQCHLFFWVNYHKHLLLCRR